MRTVHYSVPRKHMTLLTTHCPIQFAVLLRHVALAVVGSFLSKYGCVLFSARSLPYLGLPFCLDLYVSVLTMANEGLPEDNFGGN